MPPRKDARQAESRSKSSGSLLRTLSLAVTFLLIGSIGYMLTFGVGVVEKSAARRLAAQAPQIVVDWPLNRGADGMTAEGTWLAQDVRDGLLEVARGQLQSDPDPLSSEALARIGGSLHQTGWFQSMPTVRREDGGVIRVQAVWRIPVAVVRHGNLDYLVARGGELLPQAFQPGRSTYRVIQGVRLDPPRAAGGAGYGVPWPGGDVQAAIQLIELASTRPWWDQVASVDVSGFHSRKSLEMKTRWGGVVVWGGSPGDPVPGEQTTAVKLARLDTLARRFGRIDARQPRVEIFGPLTLVDESDGAALSPMPGSSAQLPGPPSP